MCLGIWDYGAVSLDRSDIRFAIAVIARGRIGGSTEGRIETSLFHAMDACKTLFLGTCCIGFCVVYGICQGLRLGSKRVNGKYWGRRRHAREMMEKSGKWMQGANVGG